MSPSRKILSQQSLALALLALVTTVTQPVWADDSRASERRDARAELFVEAVALLGKSDYEAAQRIRSKLGEYSIAPYIDYLILRRQLRAGTEVDDEVREFLEEYGRLASAPILRRSWLTQLGKRQRWKPFLDVWQPSESASQRCYWVRARMVLHADDDKLKQDALSLWLSPDDQPEACDPVFEWLEEQGELTTERRWQRIHMVLEKRRASLARYLAKGLPEEDQDTYKRWYRAYFQPEKAIDQALKAQENWTEEQLVTAMMMLARQDSDIAAERHAEVFRYFPLTDEQRAQVLQTIALRSAWQRRDKAVARLRSLPRLADSATVREWTIRAAIRAGDWQAVLAVVEAMPEAEKSQEEWRYWHARAAAATGDVETAMNSYRALAGERGYYGYLAADRLDQGYAISHRAAKSDTQMLEKLRRNAPLLRSLELYRVGQEILAVREWLAATATLSPDELLQAALLAQEAGWEFIATRGLAKAGEMDDLERRYPVPWRPMVESHAATARIDSSWVYGVIRSESLYREEARSPVGAMGLMQVMPKTGRSVAKSIQLSLPSTNTILEPDTNIRLGTTYLRQMLDRFGEHSVLATAAYNAGPHRVIRWLPETGRLDADVWVDSLPFRETRNYVKRVFEHTVVFDWRLKDDVLRLQARMPPIAAAEVLSQHQ